MQIELTRELSTVLRYASDEALRTGHRAVSPDHLLLGMLRQNNNSGVSTLRQLGIDTELFKKALDLGIMKEEALSYEEISRITMDMTSLRAINTAYYEAERYHHRRTDCIHLLLTISREPDSFGRLLLERKGIDSVVLRQKIEAFREEPEGPSEASMRIAEAIEAGIRSKLRSGIADKSALS